MSLLNETLQGKKILLGISGGIAAYKTPDLVRKLRARGADVRVVMTRAAAQFVTATSLQAVSGWPVRNSLWDASAEAAMGHIELARWADLVLVAPATAQCMASLAAGMGSDLLGTLVLASSAPLVIAPAMNQQMWQHPATQRNLVQLHSDGVTSIGPETGDQACGETGPGRMSAAEQICAALCRLTQPPLLDGLRVVVTAGPTREALDPVRYISNNSSGKQGFALAQAARDAGAEVCLISGPVDLATPAGLTRVDVTSAREMLQAVESEVEVCDLFFGVAAVSDYRPLSVSQRKIKKGSAPTVAPASGKDRAAPDTDIQLCLNPDIVATVAAREKAPFTVGFAAETHDLLTYARRKLLQKNLNAIIANDVSDSRIGFDSDHNAVTILWPGGEKTLEMATKSDLSRKIIATVAQLMDEQRTLPT